MSFGCCRNEICDIPYELKKSKRETLQAIASRNEIYATYKGPLTVVSNSFSVISTLALSLSLSLLK
jgi:hypothetical protein